jgi:hypothetical protein
MLQPRTYIDPLRTVAAPLEYFIVDMKIDNAIKLFGWQARLKWDPRILDTVNITEGDFLKTAGRTSMEFIKNEAEGWAFVWGHLDQGVNGVNGTGTLLKLAFHSIKTGECVLYLYDTKLFNSEPDLKSTPPNLGDTNNDGMVDAPDANSAAKAFGASVTDPRYNPNADFNADRLVDLFDLLCVTFNFGRRYPDAKKALRPVEISHVAENGYITIR